MLRTLAIIGLASSCSVFAHAQGSGSAAVSINGNVETKCIVASEGSLETTTERIVRPRIMITKSCNAPGIMQVQLMHRKLTEGEGVLAQFDNRMFQLDPSGLTRIDIRSTPELSLTTLQLKAANVMSPLRVVVRNAATSIG